MAYRKVPIDVTPGKNPNKSKFNLSHEWIAGIIPGFLYPCLVKELLPGDEIEIDSEFMFNFSPMYYPIMARMDMRCDYFVAPVRIVWPYLSEESQGWEKWITEQTDEIHPYINAEPFIGTVSDNASTAVYDSRQWTQLALFLGLPPTLDGGQTAVFDGVIYNANAVPFAIYWAIWDEYYRNPQIEEPKNIKLTAGDNSLQFIATVDALDRVAPAYWERDYFTAATPTPQIGEPVAFGLENPGVVKAFDGAALTGSNIGTIAYSLPGEQGEDGNFTSDLQKSGVPYTVGNETTIRQLRLAEALQSYYERVLRIGQRYRDFIKGLWGDDPMPGVVQVPVQIGSKYGRVQITDVLTTADTVYSPESARITGDYVGRAVLYSGQENKMRYTMKEHGFIFAILHVKPVTYYGQGIDRMWRKAVQQDYALDMFAHIGDQEILKEEVMYNTLISQASKNDETFGYIPRYSELKYSNNRIVNLWHQQYRSMHLGRAFDWEKIEYPGWYDENIEIDQNFITTAIVSDPIENNDTSAGKIRIKDTFKALFGTDELPLEAIIHAHVFHSFHVRRALPYYSTPDLT